MTSKVEYKRFLIEANQDGEIERVIFFRGSLSPNQKIRVAIGQINSTVSNKIEVKEGMGHATHRPEKIGEIKSLDPTDKMQRTRDLINDFLTADAVSIERSLK